MIVTALTILCILAAGLGATFVAMRLAEQRAQPSADRFDEVRPIAIVDAD